MKTLQNASINAAVAILAIAATAWAEPVGTAFTYQGQLRQGGVLVESACDFEFSLWDAESNGGQIPPLLPVTVPADEMNDGLFTVVLDFGAGAFDGDARWLELSVSCPPGAPFVTLGRQELTPAPYAIHAAGGPGDGSLWESNGSDIYYNDGNVGIGTNDPGEKLVVDGNIAARNPDNVDASIFLGFAQDGVGDDMARIRIAGTNPGGGNGLDIQGPGNVSLMRLLDNGNVGIGTTNPLAKEHIRGTNLSLTAAVLNSDDLVIEDQDAIMGLYSNDFGTFGSGLSLGETDAAGNLVDKWTLVRRTSDSAGGSALRLTFGPDADYGLNPTIMHFAPSGNVGIGTTSPEALLHIQADQNVNGYVQLSGFDNDEAWKRPILTFRRARGSTDAPAIVANGDLMGTIAAAAYDGDQYHTPAAITLRVDGEPGNDDMPGRIEFRTAPDGSTARELRMVIKNNGNVGIGTTNPAAKLHVVGNDVLTEDYASPAGLIGRRANGTSAAPTRVSTNDSLVLVGGAGYDGTAFSPPEAAMEILAAEPWETGKHGTFLRFNTTTNGGTATFERMRISQNGNVGIGTTEPNTKLTIDAGGSSVRMFNLGTSSGEVHITGPGASPGVVGFANNGNRRDIRFRDFGIQLLTSNTSAIPGNVNGINIDEAGNVGIGTTEPEERLHVDGDLKLSNGHLRLERDSANGWSQIGFAGADLTLTNRNAGSIVLYTHPTLLGSTARVAIKPDGNVGIGTTSPGGHRLRVSSSGGGSLGSTVHVKNTNTTNGIAMKLDNESTDVTLLVTNSSTVDNGDLIRADSWVGGWHPVFRVGGEGRVTCSVLAITGGSDLSEQFDVSEGDVTATPGMVVSIDPHNPGQLKVSRTAYDRTVAGVISGAGGVNPGMLMGQQGTAADGAHPVALSGRVYVRADASAGPIRPGDLLTTSDTPGHAMKVTDYGKAQGAIIGKAMTSLNEGTGLVLVLVSLQ